jgi:hypothetical protein
MIIKTSPAKPAQITTQKRRKELKKFLQQTYFGQFDDYLDAKDNLLDDLNAILVADKFPLCYKRAFEEALKKCHTFDCY